MKVVSVIMWHMIACGSDTIAYASHCVLDSSNDNRPIAGVINICPKVSYAYLTLI